MHPSHHLMGGGATPLLLPLREKVAAKPTDEGSRRRLGLSWTVISSRWARMTPHPALRATFSRKREKA